MSRNTRTATIKVDADVRKAIKGMNEVAIKVTEAEKQMLRWGESSEKAMKSFDEAGQASSTRYTQMGIGLDKLKGGLASLAGPAKVAGLAIAGIGVAAKAISSLAHESLGAQAAMNNLKWSVAGAAEASMGLVDNATLATAQVRALQLGAVDSLQGYEDLTEAGSKLGLVMMGDASKGVEDLTTALSRNSPLMLDNLGITLTLGQAKQEYAAQLGKTVAQLTEAEKAESFKTVGLQKALKAAREKNIEEGLAVDILQMEVAAMNAKTAGLGAEEAATVKLATAFEKLGPLNLKYGSDVKKLNRELLKYDTSVEELGGSLEVAKGYQVLMNRATKEAAVAAEQAAQAEERRLETLILTAAVTEAREFATQVEQQHALAVAEFGETAEGATFHIWDMAAANEDAAQKALKAARGTEAEAAAIRDLNAAMFQTELAEAKLRGLDNKPKARRSSGPKKDPLADLFKKRGDEGATGDLLKFWEDEANQKLELLESVGELRASQLEREMEAEQSAFDLRIGRMTREIEWREANGMDVETQTRQAADELEARLTATGDIDAAEEVAHIEKMRRFEEEKRAQDARMAHFTRATQATVHGLAAATEAAIAASDSKGQAFLGEVGEFAGSRAKILGIEAATHLALAAVWGAAGNPIKATMEATAGGIAAAKAAALGGIAASLSAAGGGSAGGLDSGQSAFNLGGGAPSAPSQTAGTAPVSPLEQNGQPVPAANDSGGGTVVHLNVQGSLVDSGGQLLEMIEDAKASGRGLRGGY